MKKLFVVLLSLLMLFAFVSCDDAPKRRNISNTEDFVSALNNGGFYTLSSDVVLDTSSLVSIDKDLNLDLDGHNLTIKYTVDINGADVSFSNGTMNVGGNVDDLSKSGVQVSENSVLTLNKINFVSDVTGIFAVNNNDNVTINIIDSDIKCGGYYGIGTNATAPDVSQNVIFNIVSSSVSTGVSGNNETNGDNTAILFNVQGNVRIEDSTITGDRQAMIARGGNHEFVNSTFVSTGKYAGSAYHLNDSWGSGNEVPFAALVCGNKTAGSYEYSTTVTLDNITLKAPNKAGAEDSCFAMYVYQVSSDYPVSVEGTLSIESDEKVNIDMMNGAEYAVN